MSTFLNTARARSLRPSGGLPRPRLTIVPKVAARAPRIPFAVLVVTVLAAGLVGLLLLNTSLQRGAYAVTDLQKTSDQLALRQQNLETEVAALQSPQRISERALRLGMVAGDSPAFLSLETGRVIGVPVAGKRSQRPTIDVTDPSGVGGVTGTRGAGRAPIAPTSTHHGPAKLIAFGSGELASQSAGVVTVPRKHHDRAGGPAGHKPDTHGTSPNQGTARDTNNTSNNR